MAEIDPVAYELALAQAREAEGLDLAGTVMFRPNLHPRDPLGKFKEVLGESLIDANPNGTEKSRGSKAGAAAKIGAAGAAVTAAAGAATAAYQRRKDRKVELPDGVSVKPGKHGFIVDGNGTALEVPDIDTAADEALDRSKSTQYKSIAKKVAKTVAPILAPLAGSYAKGAIGAKFGPDERETTTRMIRAAAGAIGGAAGDWKNKKNLNKQLWDMLGDMQSAQTDFAAAEGARAVSDWIIDKLVQGGLKKLNAAQSQIAGLHLALEPGSYELALAVARVEEGLELSPTTFSTGSTGPGNNFKPIAVAGAGKKAGTRRYERNRKKEGLNPTGTGEFDEKAHPRGEAGTDTGGQFIAKGDSGAAVQRIQSEIGVNPTGKFNGKTEAAIRAYQRENGLLVDGLVGQETAAALLGRETRTPGEIGENQLAALSSTAELQRAVTQYGRKKGNRKANREGGGRRAVKEATA